MNAQVTAALISGGAALTVAVLGIGGAIAAQIFATRHAFENSLALQEQQYAKQEHERHEQSRREDAYRFAEQRRSTYGRFVRLAREFLYAVEAEHSAAETLGRIDQQRNRSQPASHDLEMSAETAEQLVADARERKRRLHGEFGAACEEIYLLGSQEVRLAWFFAHGISLAEPAGSADVDGEEVQQPGLDAGGFGNRGGVAVVGGDQAEVGEGLEDGAAGGPGGGCLVAGQAGHGAAMGGQGLADLTFDEAEDQQGQADH